MYRMIQMETIRRVFPIIFLIFNALLANPYLWPAYDKVSDSGPVWQTKSAENRHCWFSVNTNLSEPIFFLGFRIYSKKIARQVPFGLKVTFWHSMTEKFKFDLKHVKIE